MYLVLVVLLILLCLGGLPQLGFQQSLGYGPSGVGGVLILILVILLLTGRL